MILKTKVAGVFDPVLTEANANNTYGTPQTHGSRYVALGDSICIAGDTLTGGVLTRYDSYPFYFSLLSGGKVQFVRNAGSGGNTLPDMLARFDTDVTPWAPNIVSVNAGTNDFTYARTQAQFCADVRTVVAKIRAIKAFPVLLTMPPVNGAASPQKLLISSTNAWIVAYGASQGITVVDMHAAVCDPATGDYLAAMDNGDGTHPSVAGRYAIGKLMADQIASPMPSVAQLGHSNVDPANGVVNPLMLTDTGGLATGWVNAAGPSVGTATMSIVTDSLVPGNMQRVTLAGATGIQYLRQAPSLATLGASAGDVLRLGCVVTNTTGITPTLAIQNIGGTSSVQLANFTKPVTRGVVVLPDWTIPAGTTAVLTDLQTAPVVAGNSGTADFGQVTVYNVTTRLLTVL